ncbi:protein translocase subunit SecF [Patescibacteria group bacterium]|nr:protein translocase subunit SecF [Patescibacteria group bacterium]
MFNLVSHRKIWYSISLVMVGLSLVAIFGWGLPLGIDFSGGTLLEVKFTQDKPDNSAIADVLAELDLGEIKIQSAGQDSILLRMKHIDNDTRIQVLENIYGLAESSETSFETIGPTIGLELREKAITAIIVVIIAIILYITWAFRKATLGPVNSWMYGLSAIIALIHDIVIITGLYALLGKFLNIELDTMFVTALLTVLGFSVHDSIVVFDRVREGLKKTYGEEFAQVVNSSIRETIIRSVNTSLTTLFVLLALFLFGGHSIRYFVLALIAGVIIGTYSSIFVASPLLVSWSKWRQRNQ